MRRYSSRKSYTWNPRIAYLTGLIAADGCLINDGRHINVTSKDYEIIQIVLQTLQFNVKVAVKTGGYHTQAYHLQFSNVAFYDFLSQIGLTPAKSKTIGQLAVPDRYYADFLRGYFDGDGTVYGFWDKRWKSSLMYYTGFVSASPKFLAWLSASNTRLAGTNSGHIKQGVRAQILTYAKADSKQLFSYMYYSAGVPRLTRKYDRFVDFLRADPYASEELYVRVL